MFHGVQLLQHILSESASGVPACELFLQPESMRAHEGACSYLAL